MASEKRQEYAAAKLTPMLEPLVTDILREMPEDPQKFMAEWAQRKVAGAAGGEEAEFAKELSRKSVAAAASKCPFLGPKTGSLENQRWWPEALNLKVLNQNSTAPNPCPDFNYREACQSVDLQELKKDIVEVLRNSQEWWPADYGHYGPLMIRLAWHSAGTYRTFDGRGGAGSGTIRFAPLNSWPDNGNLDKARRVLWPVKQKYGNKLSWADLMVYVGNVAIEDMGGKTFGFALGREDVWEPEEDIYWGPEEKWLEDQRYTGERSLEAPLGAVQMGLIYVNPGGPNGNPDPLASAKDIRDTFGRMAMNDEETVALVAGGHTFGKGHGAAPDSNCGPEPEGAAVEEQGFGWISSFGTGKGEHSITSGFEGAWTANPTKWDHGYFEQLMANEWEMVQTPAGQNVWNPVGGEAIVPDAHNPEKKHKLVMFTSDLALKMDPIYSKISQKFLEKPEEFQDAFARAWYKLTHRDMGPHCRLLGPQVAPAQIWQDPVPAGAALDAAEISAIKEKIMGSGLSISQLVATAWASASTFRVTDKRGGCNGARIQLEPMKDWESNAGLAEVVGKLNTLRGTASLADAIVLGGCAAVEAAAKQAGVEVTCKFIGGRGDATQEETEIDSANRLMPQADGFRNFFSSSAHRKPEEMLVDKAALMGLSVPQTTVLVGGLRVLGANAGNNHGVFTKAPQSLTNDFFVNLLDMSIVWSREPGTQLYNGKARAGGELLWTATSVDLIFGSNSQFRAVAELYACADAKEKFVRDFVNAWDKVMNADRFDVFKN